MRVHLQYGRTGLDVDIPGRVTVLQPRFVAGLDDEHAAFLDAIARPIEARPLAEIVRATDRVAVVIPDITRPLPSDRLLPWLFSALGHVPASQIVIVNGTGSHRVNTPDELAAMVGRDVAARYRIVNHDSHARETLVRAGIGEDGHEVWLNRDYVEADRRIVLGFIEPHFMAGFSGGYKAVFPGVADIASIMRYHDARMIGDPATTWGRLEGNPTQRRIRHDGALVPIDFCINVTLNRDRRITRFFCGDVRRGARRRLRVLARDGDGAGRPAVPDRRDDEQRLSARSESLPGREGDVGGRANRGRRRLHRGRGAMQRRVSRRTGISGRCSCGTTRRARCSIRFWRRASASTTNGRRRSSRTSG